MKAYFLSLREDTIKRGFWDYQIVEELLDGFDKVEVDSLSYEEQAVVVIPARSHHGYEHMINEELSKLNGLILFLMGDEESSFEVEKIQHPNIRIWVQNPKMGRHDVYRRLGCGYPPQLKEHIKTKLPSRDLKYFFAGQITHQRRRDMVEALRDFRDGYLLGTEGFTQGLAHPDYYEKMQKSVAVPCPSGPETVDTFRLYEALELGCVPIADIKTPRADCAGFWEWLFGQPVPFPQISDWNNAPAYIQDVVNQYPVINNDTQAFWMRYKQQLKGWLIEDIESIGGSIDYENVTVVIPTSPNPVYPDTRIISETILSVATHFPKAQIFITFDGVRKENEHLRPEYEEATRRILWQFKGLNLRPFIFKDHLHQIGMMRSIIDEIKTPLMLYVESDTPIVTDEPIEWNKIKNYILSGESNFVRLNHEAKVLDEHRHLTVGEPEDGFIKTVQWSQRPHMASTAFYKRILSEMFSEQANCFIEDVMHGKVLQDWTLYKEQGWNQWRMHIYHPGGNIKRSYHLDQRSGADKFDHNQVW